MASLTPRWQLTEIAADQAEAHVTVNEAVRKLELLAQIAAVSRLVSSPPGSPAEGDAYIVGPSPTGTWAGHANHLALRLNGSWAFLVPGEGALGWVLDEDALYVYNGTEWTLFVAGSAPGGGGGSGSLQRSITIENTTATEDITLWYTLDPIVITRLAAVLVAPTTGSPSVTWTIRWATTRDAAGTQVKIGGSVTTSESSAHVITALDNATIPAGTFLWIETSASNLVAGEHLSVTIDYDLGETESQQSFAELSQSSGQSTPQPQAFQQPAVPPQNPHAQLL